jgi:hypothetical protein
LGKLEVRCFTPFAPTFNIRRINFQNDET